MSEQKRLQPHRIAYLIDAAIISIITLLALVDRDYATTEYYLDWINLLHFIPIFAVYGITIGFYRGYKKRRSLARYLTGSLLCCVAVSMVWALFLYNVMPVSRSEEAYEQFKQRQIVLNDNAIQKITKWVDEEQLPAAQLIDSCKTYQAERRAAIRSERESSELLSRILIFLASTLIVFATVTAVHFTFQMIETENERREAEKLRIEAEHKLLKYQLNPHFLMNTLNNIHAQIDLDSEAAQESVRLLSKMMRYMLYETNQDKVSLSKEVEFLSNYFEMMRRRYIDSVAINFIVPKEIPNINVPPALFINLAENAFKHGVTYNANSYVHFELTVDPHTITCRVENSKIKNKADIQESFGFGVESLRKRLNLLYGKHHTYDIRETDNEYNVLLIIPIV